MSVYSGPKGAFIPGGEGGDVAARKLGVAMTERALATLKAMALERSVRDRYDRSCHGGIVRYRLPLRYRLEAANRFPGRADRNGVR